MSHSCASSMTILRTVPIFLLVHWFATVLVGQTPSVQSVTPLAESVGAPTLTPITATFNTAINLQLVGPDTFHVFGRLSGVRAGTYHQGPGSQTIVFRPTTPFAAGESVTVTLTSGLISAGGITLPSPYSWQFWVESLPAVLSYGPSVVLSTQTGAITRPYGAYGGDLNADGLPDLCVPCEVSNDIRVFMNDGSGGFAGPPLVIPLANAPSPSEGADMNGDGLLDVVVIGVFGTLGILLNDGAGSLLPPLTYPLGGTAHGMVVMDVDHDDDLDIVVAYTSTSVVGVFLGNGNGTVQSPTFFDGGSENEWSMAAADFNHDGLMDLVVGFNSGFGYGGGPNSRIRILLNNGSGGFAASVTLTCASVPRQVMTGDVDGDGHADVVAALAGGQTLLSRGNGSGGLGAPTLLGGPAHAVATDLGDLDGDGDLDIVTTNYFGQWQIYANDGTGGFPAPPVTLAGITNPGCAVLLDLNGDGRLSIVGIDEVADNLLFFHPAFPTVQPFHPTGGLRVNGSAGTPGFLGVSPQPLSLGSVATLEVQGIAGATAFLFLGIGLEPGLPTPLGPVNLDLFTQFPFQLFAGPLGASPTPFSALGSVSLSQLIPASLPVGVQFTVQALVAHTGLPIGLLTTNPLTMVTSL